MTLGRPIVCTRCCGPWIAVALFGWASAALGQGALEYPLAVAVGPPGRVFIADRNLPGVWRLDQDRLEVYYQASKQQRTPLSAIRCLAVDRDGRLLAGDSSTREVYRFDETGKPRPLTSPGRPPGRIRIPSGIAVDARGDILAADLETNRVVKIPAEGGAAAEFAAVASPRGIAIDREERLWVISGRRLARIGPGGGTQIIVEEGVFQYPNAVAIGGDGAVYVSDGWGRAIWRIADDGKPEKWAAGEPLDNPVGIAFEGDKLLVADPRAKAVFDVDTEGKISRRPLRVPPEEP